MSAIEAARERCTRTWTAFTKTKELAERAEAELARLVLLELAAGDSDLRGIKFESHYEYDDEGGYFRTTSVYGLYDENGPVEAYLEEMEGFSLEALALLCEAGVDTDEGRVTIEQARERRF